MRRMSRSLYRDGELSAGGHRESKAISCVHFLQCRMLAVMMHDTKCLQSPTNIFNTLPALSAPSGNELCGELNRYLGADPEMVDDVLSWWDE